MKGGRFDHRGLVVIHAHTEGADVLSLIGELDTEGASRFVSQAADALRDGAKRLFIELEGVPFVDSGGLAALLNVLRRANAAGAAMVLVRPQPQVRDVLEQTRLDREFTLAESVPEAAARVQPPE